MKIRKLSAVVLAGLVATVLVACGGGSAVASKTESSLNEVPGVVSAKTEFRNSAGMSSRINVRIIASPDADLYTVLDDSLRAFADASGDTKGSISVSYYVHTEGAEETGIRPDAAGLKTTPSVDDIRNYAGYGG
ncbi:hypothetical protein GCM10011313_23170 [Mycetocola zhadangensis]|nr:hypothetical protein GCM10011313_23170 [Mycetocola zhadangensis]